MSYGKRRQPKNRNKLPFSGGGDNRIERQQNHKISLDLVLTGYLASCQKASHNKLVHTVPMTHESSSPVYNHSLDSRVLRTTYALAQAAVEPGV